LCRQVSWLTARAFLSDLPGIQRGSPVAYMEETRRLQLRAQPRDRRDCFLPCSLLDAACLRARHHRHTPIADHQRRTVNANSESRWQLKMRMPNYHDRHARRSSERSVNPSGSASADKYPLSIHLQRAPPRELARCHRPPLRGIRSAGSRFSFRDTRPRKFHTRRRARY
jgi:hypothetical protein